MRASPFRAGQQPPQRLPRLTETSAGGSGHVHMVAVRAWQVRGQAPF